MADAVDVLEGAEGLISLGWCRDDLYKDIGGADHYCMVGGVRYSHQGSAAAKRKAVTEMWLTLYDLELVPWCGNYYGRFAAVTEYNDCQRNKRGPLKIIRTTIDRLVSTSQYRHHRH